MYCKAEKQFMATLVAAVEHCKRRVLCATAAYRYFQPLQVTGESVFHLAEAVERPSERYRKVREDYG